MPLWVNSLTTVDLRFLLVCEQTHIAFKTRRFLRMLHLAARYGKILRYLVLLSLFPCRRASTGPLARHCDNT